MTTPTQAQIEAAETMEEALQRIVQWSKAYPLDIFPEPDFKKAAEALKANGMTLDAISASCMRHVVEGVGKIARDALTAAQVGECHPAACRDEQLWRNEIASTIERCAQVAEGIDDAHAGVVSRFIATAIRKLKDGA